MRLLSIILLFVASVSYSQTVTNGSVTGAPVGNSQLANAAGWSGCGFSPDLCNVGFPSYSGNSSVTPVASPDGGSWLGMASLDECAQTSITGLIPGNNYTLCFYGACFGSGTSIFDGGPAQPAITIGASTQSFVIPKAANTWNLYTMPFTATATTMTLQIIATNVTASVWGAPGAFFVGLDGFTISVPGATATWTNPSPLCSGQAPINLDALVTGTAGGVWSGAGVTGNTFDPAVGTQNVTYTVNPGSCNEVTSTQTITVNSGANPAWTPPINVCDNDPLINLNALITGDPGGTWSGTGVTGSNFNPAVGTQSITYSVGVVPCNTSSTQTITVGAFGDATWTAPTGLCTGDAPVDLSTFVTGTGGGTWSGTGMTGSVFDPAVGTQTITYSAGTAPCNATLALTITVNNGASPAWIPPLNVCDNDPLIDLNTLITGTAGGTWSGTGVTGSNFNPAVGTQTITYSVGTVPCNASSAQTITVGAFGDPAWTIPTGLCTGSAPIDLNTYITGTTGGTWSGTGVTGSMFDPAVGSQTITYNVGTAPCDGTSAQLINVTPAATATWTIPAGVCTGDPSIDLNTLITGTTGGTWSGTGVSGSMFNPAVGTQSITYSVGVAPCDATVTQTITVDISGTATWNPPANLCDSDGPIDLTSLVTGTAGGTWSGTGVTGTTFDPSFGTQTITYTVGTGVCQDVSAQAINVTPSPDPSWTPITLCSSSAPVNLTSQVTGTPGGTWSGTGMSGNVFDPFFGTQSITYTAVSGTCTASSTQTITVVNPVVATTGNPVSCFGLTDGSATATVSGGSGNYTFSWDSNPPQTTANATGLGAGTYTVTVTDVNGGCSVTQTYTVIEPAQIVLSMSGVDACSPDLGSASVAATGGVGGFTYAWSPVASTTASVSGLDSAMAYVTVTDNNGCSNQDSVFINIWPSPTVTISPDTLIYYGDAASLTASGGIFYQWTPTSDLSCSDCPNPFAEPLITTEYCVTVIDGHGCQNNACTTVSVEIVCGDVFVPSAFSPNDDGENDALCVYSDCMESMVFTVYNRWGEKVFESSSKTICWDGTWNGKVLNSAVFVYILEGYLINGQRVDQKGNISLVR